MKRVFLFLSFLSVGLRSFGAITDNLVSYWQFEGAASSDQTDSFGSHTLTHKGNPTQDATHKGGSWSSGIGSGNYYTNFDSVLGNSTATFTLVTWIRTTSTDITGQAIWARFGLSDNIWACYGVGTAGAGNWEMLPRKSDNSANDTPAVSTVTWTANAWHMIAIGNKAGSYVWISVDAETKLTASNTGLRNAAEALETGLGGVGPSSTLLDDTAYWSRELTAGDIANLYTNDMRTLLLGTPIGCTNGSFTYTSTIDPSYTNLYAVFSYPTNGPATNNLPIICVIHPFSFDTNTGGATNIGPAQRETIATNYPVFVVSPGMRGRDGAKGLPDGSAREIYDIRDCIEFVKNNYSAVAATTNITVVGYSGGGANALNFGVKFPDYASQIADYFGISDYGSNNVTYSDAVWGTNANGHGWGYQIAAEWSYLASSGPAWAPEIGDRTNYPNAYFCRAAVYALGTNLQGGHLWNYHQHADSTVWYDQSIQLTNSFNAIGNTRITARHSASLYEHKMPDGTSPTPYLADSANDWLSGATNATYPAWTFPAAGYCRVMGYLVTKRFTIWLDNSGDTAGIGGTNQVADVSYTRGFYTVTPRTGTVKVSITEGSCSVTNTISSATTIAMCPSNKIATHNAVIHNAKLGGS